MTSKNNLKLFVFDLGMLYNFGKVSHYFINFP